MAHILFSTRALMADMSSKLGFPVTREYLWMFAAQVDKNHWQGLIPKDKYDLISDLITADDKKLIDRCTRGFISTQDRRIKAIHEKIESYLREHRMSGFNDPYSVITKAAL